MVGEDGRAEEGEGSAEAAGAGVGDAVKTSARQTEAGEAESIVIAADLPEVDATGETGGLAGVAISQKSSGAKSIKFWTGMLVEAALRKVEEQSEVRKERRK